MNPKNPLRYKIEFIFPFKEAEKLGYHKNTFPNVIRELVQKGFLDPVKKGYRKNFVGGGLSRFRLAERWRSYGTDNFVKVEWNSFINPNQ
ncbi:MAG: hypothetical protein NTU69_12815 [Proteobacteria bacterium]|nr:hypothetical protein [Pseudomonadota bacterium]